MRGEGVSPARPQATPLYLLVETTYEEVKGQWEERFEGRYGFWRGPVVEQVGRYLDCGLFENVSPASSAQSVTPTTCSP